MAWIIVCREALMHHSTKWHHLKLPNDSAYNRPRMTSQCVLEVVRSTSSSLSRVIGEWAEIRTMGLQLAMKNEYTSATFRYSFSSPG